MVCEPTPTYRAAVAEREVCPMYGDGVDDEEELDEIPEIGDHWSWERLMESIEYCKTIADDPTKWEPYDDFKERLYEEFPWLR